MTVYNGDAQNLTLLNGDVVTPFARITSASPNDAAIYAFSGVTARIGGTVYGQTALAIYEGSFVTLSGTAKVSGIKTGSAVVGGTLANYGVVDGEQYGVSASQSATVLNYGTISSVGTAVDLIFSRTISITNTGTMIGSRGIVSDQSYLKIDNSGVIASTNGTTGDGVSLGTGRLELKNTGTIIGKIQTIASEDKVFNDGLIRGNVQLGGRNDTYSGVGRVEGIVYGEADNDVLTGGIYDDRLDGGANDDILDGGRGNDTLTGGTGNDTFYVDAIGDRVIEAVGGGSDTVYTTVSYVLRTGQEIETLAVNPDADYASLALNLMGNEFANALIGNAANNRLNGGGGADTMTGGLGDDIYYVDDAGDVVIEAANQGTDTVYTTVTHTLSANVEILRAQGTADIALAGNGLANTIVGNAGNNRIDGGVGADTMKGGTGDDTYVVDNVLDLVVEAIDGGNDTIEASVSYALTGRVETLILTGTAAIDGTGNALANTIVGNGAANTITGKGGHDMLTGGGGADTFVFASKLDAAVNFATITDFEHGVDRIVLDDRYFKFIGAGGALGEQFFTFSAPTTRDQHIIYDQATGLLSYDSDGSGAKAAIAFAQVTPGTVLDHHDFLIV